GSLGLSANRVFVRNANVLATAVDTGGDIAIVAPAQLSLVNGHVQTHSGSLGGSIFTSAIAVTLLHSDITAFSDNPLGGNLKIAAPALLLRQNSFLCASGRLQTTVPESDIAGSLVALPGGLTDAGAGLLPQCGLELGGQASSFIVTG